mgnify:CR=1 FL=1|jgi:hypothetical protein
MDSQVVINGTWYAGKIPCNFYKKYDNYTIKIKNNISKKFYFTKGLENLALYEAYMWGLSYNYFVNNYRYSFDVNGNPLFIEIDLENGHIMKCELEDSTNISSYIWYYRNGKAYTHSSIDRDFQEVSFLEMKYPHHTKQFDFLFENGDVLDYRYDNIKLGLNREYVYKLTNALSHPEMVDQETRNKLIQTNVLADSKETQTTNIQILDKKEYKCIGIQTDHVNICKRNIRNKPIIKKRKPQLTETESIILCSIKPEKKKTLKQKIRNNYFHIRNKCVDIFNRRSSQIIILSYGTLCIVMMFIVMYYISNQ